jgi:hypothetical protein
MRSQIEAQQFFLQFCPSPSFIPNNRFWRIERGDEVLDKNEGKNSTAMSEIKARERLINVIQLDSMSLRSLRTLCVACPCRGTFFSRTMTTMKPAFAVDRLPIRRSRIC